MCLPRAILFDLDGTLTDRRASLHAYAIQFLKRFEDDLSPAVTAAIVAETITSVDRRGLARRPAIWSKLLLKLDWRRPPPWRELGVFWAVTFPSCARPVPRLSETLSTLCANGMRLGVVTNGSPMMQDGKLDALGIRKLLSVVVVSGKVGVSKPDCRIFEIALAAVDVAPSEAWYVGDHPEVDIAGANRAGLTSVWVTGGGFPQHDRVSADHTIGSLSDLPPILWPVTGRVT